MAIFKTPYDTSIGTMYNASIGKITSEIEKVLISNSLYRPENSKLEVGRDQIDYGFITGLNTQELAVPNFIHPIVVKTKDKSIIVADVRHCVRVSATSSFGSSEVVIKNSSEFEYAQARLLSTRAWIDNPNSGISFRGFNTLPMTIYSSWISETIAKRYALDPKDQLILSIISCFFYITLFENKPVRTEDEVLRFVNLINRTTKAPSDMIANVAYKLEELNNVKDFCENIKLILENPRLEDFNTGILITLIGNTFFGTNAKELLAVSLEHPPTFISTVFTAFKEKTFKHSVIGKLTDRYAGNKGGNGFMQGFVSLCSY